MMNETEGILNFLDEAQKEIKNRIPDVMNNFQGFSQAVIREGLLTPKMKELIAVAVSVGIRCQP